MSATWLILTSFSSNSSPAVYLKCPQQMISSRPNSKVFVLISSCPSFCPQLGLFLPDQSLISLFPVSIRICLRDILLFPILSYFIRSHGFHIAYMLVPNFVSLSRFPSIHSSVLKYFSDIAAYMFHRLLKLIPMFPFLIYSVLEVCISVSIENITTYLTG